MVKKKVVPGIKEISEALEGDKVIIGTERTLKALKKGELKKVFLSSNTSSEVIEDVEKFAQLSGVEVVRLEHPNDELGALCKKPFSISVLGLK